MKFSLKKTILILALAIGILFSISAYLLVHFGSPRSEEIILAKIENLNTENKYSLNINLEKVSPGWQILLSESDSVFERIKNENTQFVVKNLTTNDLYFMTEYGGDLKVALSETITLFDGPYCDSKTNKGRIWVQNYSGSEIKFNLEIYFTEKIQPFEKPIEVIAYWQDNM